MTHELSWDEICRGADCYRGSARFCGLADEYDAVRARTVDGSGTLDSWRELLERLEERFFEQEDLESRGWADVAPANDGQDDDGPFGCPKERCGRRAEADALGDPPQCPLFGEQMAERPD